MVKGELSVVKVIDEYNVEIRHFMDNALVIPIAKSMSTNVGFSDVDATMIATIASELATNIIRYAKSGEIILRICTSTNNTTKKAIEVEAVDNGPGIYDIEKALSDSYTTTENSLGMGLPSVKTYMDEFYINTSRETGTQIIVRKWCNYEKSRSWI